MSDATDKILTSERPNNDKGWIEYALSLGWEELPMGYEYVTNNAAAELAALREANDSLEGMVERLAQADAQKHREIIALRERVAGLERENAALKNDGLCHCAITKTTVVTPGSLCPDCYLPYFKA